MKNLTEGNPVKLMLSFALPVCIGNIFQLFYSLADTRIVGSVLGGNSLAAVGATTAISTLLIGFLQGLTNGFAIIAARSFGAKRWEELRKAAAGTLLLGGATTAAIMLPVLLGLKGILRLLNVPDELLQEAYGYIFIVLAGMMITMLYNACAGILRAIGDTTAPLLFLICAAFLNVGLDILFMAVLPLGVQGAALGTVLAQLVSVIFCFLYIWKKYPVFHLKKEDFRLEISLVKQMYTSGMSMGMTMATFCGQNFGAGKYDRMKMGIKNALFITWGWSVLVIFMSYTVAPFFVSMVTGSHEKIVIDTAVLYLKINAPFYFLAAGISIFRNALQAVGDHKTPVISSFIELLGKVLIAALLSPVLEYMGIIIAEPVIWILMIIPLVVKLVKNPVFRKGYLE